jgi:hypothetical protein
MRTLLWAFAFAWALGLAGSPFARADRRPFAFTYDTETLARGDLELEEWIWGKVNPPSPKTTSAWLWFSPVYGLFRRVEVAIPWEVVAVGAGAQIADFSPEVRVALTDPLDTGLVFRSLLKLGYQFNFNNPVNEGRELKPWITANWVSSFWDTSSTHLAIDIGYYGDAGLASQQLSYTTLGVGFTYSVLPELRMGAEYFDEISLGSLDSGVSRFYLGPNLAFSRDRLWATLGVLFGLGGNAAAELPRLIIGMSL